MSSKGKALAPRPSDQRSVTRTHMGEGENQLLQIVLRSPRMLYGIFAHTPLQKKKKKFEK